MKVYMIGEYMFDGGETAYRAFHEEADAKRFARELIEECVEEDYVEKDWEEFLETWNCVECFMEELEVE